MLAEVAFNLPSERTFTYLVPEALEAAAARGARVLAPFGPRERTGLIVSHPSRSAVPGLKPIRRVIDPAPVIDGERWALAEWMAVYYGCSFGEALSAMVPSALRWHQLEAGPQPAVSEDTPGIELTKEQRAAMAAIEAALAAPASRTVLIHGVTGSGKTELYLRAIARVLSEGRSAICLIPEIALTPQTTDRFRRRFGEQVALWHSRMTDRERGAAWARIASGHSRIVVGARSAAFAPLSRLGLIILDEEHEGSYKQDETPRYHARDVARERARLANATVLLGSATPSIESFYEAQHGRYELVTLKARVHGRPMPAVELIDLREELASGRRAAPLSAPLSRALEQVLGRGEQAMLLLNRRGFARVVQCHSCGTTIRCRDCAVPLIYHAETRALRCHYCNFTQEMAEICPVCKKDYLRARGTGTERVESELHRMFPGQAISRMDRDSTKARDSHQRLYDAMRAGDTEVVVGTQMIAKGLDFAGVTLVGIVSADTELNLPDFRAGERTFTLLTQMAGRAGRGEQPGRVLVQTYCPEHYAIRAARTHDYAAFYAEEVKMREDLGLPPFQHLVELLLAAPVKPKVEAASEALAQALRREGGKHGIHLLGPAPHRIPRLRRRYRMRMVLKGGDVPEMVRMIRKALQPGRRYAGVPVVIDVDPV